MSTFELDEYIVDKKRIGKGSFSIVYKAEHKLNKKLVAIKEISVDNISKIKENIKREVNVMKNLDHENIVKLHNVIIDKKYDNIYLVFDYYPLGDLANFLNKQCLKEIYAQRYTIQLSKGLEYLYNNRIIHRDLKPQNILVTKAYNLKITDFGFARYFDSDIMIQTICGSPIYMAPEIMRNKKYNNKSDLWSVGVILYEMLIGHPPFRSKNILELLTKIRTQKILIPLNIKLSDNCLKLLFNLLKIDPDKRISWNDFFTDKWLEKDMLLENENKMLDIDSYITSSKNNLPNPDDLKLSSLFYNFNYKSISENKMEKNKEDNLLNDVMFNNLSEEHESLEESDTDSDSYLSASEDIINTELSDYLNNMNIEKSKPIPIQNSKFVHVTNDMITSKCQMFNSKINQDYIVIPSNSPKYINSDPVGISPSLKEMLNTSLTIIKASYEYISNRSI